MVKTVIHSLMMCLFVAVMSPAFAITGEKRNSQNSMMAYTPKLASETTPMQWL
jgi:hypothetical protein